tara:strand:+ start:2705 stop:3100 length:396 start_codon:yes stop_codon:yes gene_type:complete
MLTLRDPFADFPSLFSSRVHGTNGTADRWSPPLDIVEDDTTIHISMEVPGMSLSDLQVEVGSGVITISGEKKKSTIKAHRVESRSGKFVRALRLPKDANVDEIEADLSQGILTISIPRSIPKKTLIKIGEK